ncbi:hypothetical protein NMY22_g8601 [Coprinellus aureogranulatus]|nr:hypothetical protein NMY22_g8601 [Coprinellus aureogranulatus]
MGQRHQLFLVARVSKAPGSPKAYRCVAAFHHQWCYGRLPLRCVARFKHLARVKDNADLIQRDLDRYPEGVEKSSAIPCPFISFLARGAFSTDNECDYGEPYSTGVLLEPAHMGSTDGDNNDGITIIDITVPGEPKYCFASFRGLEAAQVVPQRVPLTATQYVRAYHPKILDPLADEEAQTEEAYNLKAIADLDDLPVLTLDVLAATWPHEYKLKEGDGATTPEDSGGVGQSASGDDAKEGVQSTKATEGSVVDFSRRGLSSTELLNVLKESAPFRRLDISHNSAVDKATLTDILAEHRPEWLNIDGCSITTEDMVELLNSKTSLFRGVEAIIHPALLSLENLEEVLTGLPSAFRFYYGGTEYISLPFFGADQLVQSLIDVIEVRGRPVAPSNSPMFGIQQLFQSLALAGFLQVKSNLSLGPYPSPTNLQHSFGCLPRADGQPWRERAVQTIPLLTQGTEYPECYSFVFVAEDQWTVHGKTGTHYGFIVPGANEFVDAPTFLEHLEKDGWPKPENQGAVKRLVKMLDEKLTLLKDLDGTLKQLGFKKEL